MGVMCAVELLLGFFMLREMAHEGCCKNSCCQDFNMFFKISRDDCGWDGAGGTTNCTTALEIFAHRH